MQSRCIILVKSSICNWVKSIGEKNVDKRKGRKIEHRKTKIPKDIEDNIRDLFTESPTRIVMDVHQIVRAKYGNSMSTTRRIIKKIGFTRKKVSVLLNPNTPEQVEKIDKFKQIMQTFSTEDVVSIDESSFDSRMRSTHGYSAKGERIRHKQTVTSRNRHSLCCGVSVSGIEAYRIVEGSMNTFEFIQYLKDLLPNCKQKVVLLDNVGFHRNKEVLKLISDHGKQAVFVPPYSPQFNPIEHVFSSMKTAFLKMR